MRVAVIGSGVGGLAVAIRLASRGYDVVVFEANDYPGGKLTKIEKDGFTWDAGPSLFTMPHFVDEVLRKAGLSENEFEYYEMDEACRYFWEDGTKISAHSDRTEFAQEVEDKLGVRASKVVKALSDSADSYNAVSPLFLEKSLHKVPKLLSAEMLRMVASLPKLNLHKTMHAVNQARFNHPKLVQLFDRFATYNGSSPYSASGVMNVIPHLEHNIGTYLPEGGMHSITRSLLKAAELSGVEIRLNSPVSRINVENGEVQGVVVDGEFHDFDSVVSNMDVVPTYRKLLPNRYSEKQVLEQERSSSAVIFYWGIKGANENLGLHNILFSDDYKAEFDHLFKSRDLIKDPTVYINITSKHLKGQAPEGHENWFVMINAPANVGQDWNTLIGLAKERIIHKIERVIGFDVRDRIVCEEILDPRSIELNTGSYQGSLYGTSSNNWKSAFLRHPNFRQDIKGLFFCGGSVHPGGGIPLCLLSAKIVDELIAA